MLRIIIQIFVSSDINSVKKIHAVFHRENENEKLSSALNTLSVSAIKISYIRFV